MFIAIKIKDWSDFLSVLQRRIGAYTEQRYYCQTLVRDIWLTKIQQYVEDFLNILISSQYAVRMNLLHYI